MILLLRSQHAVRRGIEKLRYTSFVDAGIKGWLTFKAWVIKAGETMVAALLCSVASLLAAEC